MKGTSLTRRKAAQTINLIVFIMLIFSGPAIRAQSGATPLALAPGSPAGSYQLSDIDSVNLFNGRINVRMPILTVAGRGSAAGQMTLNWSSPANYHVRSDVDPNNGSQLNYVEPGGGGAFSPDGISLGFAQVYGIQAGSPVSTPCSIGGYSTYQKTLTRLYFVEPDGTEHEMRDVQTGGQPFSVSACALNGTSRGKIFVSTDGSGATFIADDPVVDYIFAGGDFPFINPSGYLLLSNGTRYRVNGLDAVIRDRNGNLLTQTFVSNPPVFQYEIKDSLNRKIIRNTGACPPPFSGTCPFLSYKGYNGASRGVSFAGSDPIQMILPNGRAYKFYLNQYGDLTRIDLPTGGSIEYDYGPGLDGPQPNVSYWIQNSMPGTYMIGLGAGVVYRRVTERRVYKEGHVLENRQTFSKPEYLDGSNPNPLNLGYVDKKQYAANGNLVFTERHFFYGAATNSFYVGSIDYPSWKEGREYHSEFYDENGNLQRQTNLTWEQRAAVSWWNGSADASPQLDPRLAQSSTVLENGQTSTTINGYDPTVPYNSLTDVYQYDFGGALLRRTQTTFVKTLNGTDYTGTNIQNPNSPYMRDLPSQVSVFDATGERGRTSFEYDNYSGTTNHAALVARSGISGLDSSFTTSYTYRGNATGVTNYLLASGVVTGSVSTFMQYDVAGNVVKSIDARGNASTLQYSDCYGSPNGEARTNSAPTELSSVAQSSFAFPTVLTNALNQTTYNQFDYYLGRTVDSEDVNGIVSSAVFNDSLDRPTQIIRAANQSTAIKNQTTYGYDDGNRIVTVTADVASYNDPNPYKTETVYGSFGEAIETRQYEGGSNYIATQIQYDNFGRPFKRSNPFRPWQSETPVWTTTVFDALGRTKSVTTPDNAAVTTSYNGNSMTVTDPASKARKSVTDALGRLTEVYEDPNGFNYQTSYLYDGLDNLLRVTQGSQQRFFMYDSLKRLIRADNPEQETLSTLSLTDPVTSHSNWTVKYEYDNNGNLTFRTDARGVVTENRYDVLNRLTTVLYRINGQPDPNTGDIEYLYDNATNGKGRLWLTYRWGAKPSHTAIGEYDAMGRVKQLWNLFGDGQGGWSAGYGVSRNYNHAGQVTSQTYPSGRTVNYAYDGAGRPSGFTGNLGDGVTRSYASAFVYNARSQVTQELFGTQTQLYHKLQYNIRGQLWDVRVSTNNDVNGSANRGALQYFYDNSFGYGTSGPDNNGNVLFAQTYTPEDDQGLHWAYQQQSYAYDSVNRLKSVTEYFVNYSQQQSQQQFVQTYDYDRWGNRTIITAQTSGTGINNTAYEVETARNRMYSPGDLALAESQRRIAYDKAGNQIKDTYTGTGTATFDGDNYIVAIQDKFGGSSTYTYNANSQRIRRRINNQETWQIYGIDGELVAEYAANAALGTPQKEYGYRDGQLLITAASSGLKGNWKLDENSGTTAADSSGNSNTGTLTSGATWTTGQSGSAVNLDGVDDYVQVGAQSSLALTNAGTLSAWIYPTGAGSLATYGGIIINKEGEYELARFQDGTIQWAFANTSPGWNWINTGYVAPLNQWTHVAVTYDGGVVKTYINGTLFHTYSGSGTIGDVDGSQNDFRIGGRQVTSHNFQGRIDEVRVYNRVLSGSEVTGLPGGSSSSSTQINWLVPDHLGTPRIILDQTGSFASVRRHDYLPFGEELPAGTGGRTPAMGYVAGDGVRQQFTSKERDVETGLDYFGARFFASVQGRFTSPDPLLQSGRAAIPQSWNRYAYVLNNPLRLIDPEGLADIDANEEEQKRQEQQKQQQQQTQVVDLRKDRVITAEVNKIQADAKPLPEGVTPVLSDVRVVVGETVSVNNGTVVDGYGNYTEGFTGVVRPVAYIPLNQNGNIIEGNGVAVQENVRVVSGDKPRTTDEPAPTPKGGVFIDAQLLASGRPTTTIQQAVFVGQFPRSGGPATTVFRTGVNEITKNADTRTVSVRLGPTQRVR